MNLYTNYNIIANAQPLTPSSPDTNTGLPTIQITSLQDGQVVPLGSLIIQGISSDDEETDCRVYADVNDITPMRNATAAGPSGENDFSIWTFTYTLEYQYIKEGENELTAKISCFDNSESDLNPFPTGTASAADSSTPLSEWHTVNVTGVAGASPVPLPSAVAGNTEVLEDGDDVSDEDSDDNNEEVEDSNNGGNSEGDNNDSFDGVTIFD